MLLLVTSVFVAAADFQFNESDTDYGCFVHASASVSGTAHDDGSKSNVSYGHNVWDADSGDEYWVYGSWIKNTPGTSYVASGTVKAETKGEVGYGIIHFTDYCHAIAVFG
ncbi:MAG: hypothetical protein ACXQS3_04485 [Candidatus Methanofastidiosia archaeon]